MCFPLRYACAAVAFVLTTSGLGSAQGLNSLYFPGSDHVYYVATNQHICASYVTSQGWQSIDVTANSDHPTTLAASAGTITTLNVTGGDHMYYFDTDGHLRQLFYISAGYFVNQDISAGATPTSAATPATLPTPISGSPLASAYFNGTDHVFYVSTSRHIIHFFWDGQQWRDEDMMALLGIATPAAVISGLSASTAADDSARIYYIADNRHINVLLWGNHQWTNEDWTSFAGNKALAAFGSALTGFTGPDGTTRMFYFDGQPHVTELWWNQQFQNEDLTQKSGALTLPVTGSGITSFAGPNGTAYVYYTDTQQHINQLGWNGQVWTNTDLSTASAIPLTTTTLIYTLAAPQAALTSLLITGGNHVYYVATDGHVHQIYWTGQSWTDQDVTSMSHAQAVTSGIGTGAPMPYVREYIYGSGKVIATENGQFGVQPVWTLGPYVH